MKAKQLDGLTRAWLIEPNPFNRMELEQRIRDIETDKDYPEEVNIRKLRAGYFSLYAIYPDGREVEKTGRLDEVMKGLQC